MLRGQSHLPDLIIPVCNRDFLDVGIVEALYRCVEYRGVECFV